MKSIKIETLEIILKHYSKCVNEILNNKKHKKESLIDLCNDFNELAKDIKSAETLEDIDLYIDRPITYECQYEAF